MLRELPARALGRCKPAREAGSATLLDLIKHEFFLVDEHPGREIVLGTIGKFWTLQGGGMENFTAGDLEEPLPRGTAAAVWNFRVARDAHGSIIHTETRVRCADSSARLKFRLYWTFVGPFSGLIRSRMLQSVKEAAKDVPPIDHRVVSDGFQRAADLRRTRHGGKPDQR